MKLLIITQKVDRNDPILGFFHRWIVEFAKNCEKVTVICLMQGEYDLPENVKVLSLGKEKGISRLKYLFNFYRYIWQERKNYDTVFVHMNQEYVILGWKFWKLWGKKIWLWRNHPQGSLWTRIAVFVSDRVFCTSKYSFTARFKKTEIMPVGIDTDFFKRDISIEKKPNSILFLGRISPIKKPEILIEAAGLLKKENIDFTLTIVGDPLPKDEIFYLNLKSRVGELDLENEVTFLPSVSNNETVKIYNSHEIFINLTPTGSLDKTIFEAMACETFVLTSNPSLADYLSFEFILKDSKIDNLAEKIKKIFLLSKEEKEKLSRDFRQGVKNNHSLSLVIKKVIRIVS